MRFWLVTSSTLKVTCVAGVRKGRGRELGLETARKGGGKRGTPESKPLGTFSIRFFVGNGKPQTARCHVTTALRSRLQFAVHV